MKKEVIFLLAVLPGVLAATLEDSRIIIILPLFLAGLGILFFVIIYLKDNFGKIQKIKMIPKFNKKSSKHTKKEEEIIEGHERDFHGESKELDSNFDKLSPEEIIKSISGISNAFFRDILKTNVNLTHDEISSNPEKINQNWVEFSGKLEELKYGGKEVSKKQLKLLLNQLLEISKHKRKRKVKLDEFGKLKKKELEIEIKILKFLKGIFGERKDRPNLFDFLKHFFVFNKEKLSSIGRKEKELTIKEPTKKGFIEKISKEIKSEGINLLNIRKEINDFKEKISNPLKTRLSERKEEVVIDMIKKCRESLQQEDIIEAREDYMKILEKYYKLPVETQLKINQDIGDIKESIDNFEEYKEKMKIEEMGKELERIKNKNKVYIIGEPEIKESKLNKAEKQVLKTEKRALKYLLEDIDGLKDYTSSINHKGKLFFRRNKKNILNEINKINTKIESIEESFIFKLNKEQKRFIKDTKKVLSKKEEHVGSQERLRKMNEELAKIKDENEVYVIGIPSIEKKQKSKLKSKEKHMLNELIKDMDKIKEYASSITKKEEHLFRSGKKNFLYMINELNEKIRNIEKSLAHKMNKRERKFIMEIKNVLPKTKEFLQMNIDTTTRFIEDYYHKEGLRYKNEKNHIIITLKNILEHIIEMERKGIYSLNKRGKNLIESFENKIKEIGIDINKTKDKTSHYFEKESEDSVKKIESSAKKVESTTETLNKGIKKLLSNLKKNELEFLNKIVQKRKITSPLKSSEEKISDFVSEMQESKMLKINKIEKAPTKKIDIITEPYQDEKIKRLNKEEERIFKRMDKIDKKPIRIRPTKQFQMKRLRKYGWEIAANKIRNEHIIHEPKLTTEETKLLEKLNKLN